MVKLLLLFILSSFVIASDIEFLDDFDEAMVQAKEQNKPVMLMYTMEDCGMCWFMKNKVFTQASVSSYINEHFIPLQIDTEDEVIERYKPVGTPTFFFLRADGSIVGKVVGGAKAKPFKERLEKINKRFRQ